MPGLIDTMYSAGSSGGNGGNTTLNWGDYLLGVEYTGTDTQLTDGLVSEALYEDQTIYRYIDDTENTRGYPLLDAFYSDFDGTTLSGLLAQRSTING